ncbi:MAG: sugar-binding domain-containing protein, partial [Eudoraea sp.]|uniref:sugar-binding domain-containing protein n=1 Tax=Eudoraea sp. TaxID=1979955 RepID=UPI003C731E43
MWYRRNFKASLKNDKRYFIHFGAINYESHIYLNGKKLGVNKGGFTPFQFEVGDKLIDGENFLVVMVDNTRKKDEVPTINTDWWNYGGITRDVNLIETPESFINDYKIQLATNDASKIKGYIELEGSVGEESVVLQIPELKINQS